MTNWVPRLKHGRTALIIIAVVCLSVSKAVPPKGAVGAMVHSKFASANANAFSTIYWEESTRNKKSERKKVCSTDGYEYYFSMSSKSSYYVCKNNKGRSCKCREHSSGKLTDRPCQCRRPPCSGTLVVHPNGKVVNNVKHSCKPDENVIRSGQEILDERRSRQSEESGCSSSILMPYSATSPTLTMEQLLQPLSDATRKTATSHTQHDNPSNLDMQQGGPPLEQQPSFPGESGASHTECVREQGDELLDYNYLLQFSSTGNVKHACKPDENVIRSGREILDERRSRQSEESGCSSSILMPYSATSPTLTMEQLLQPLSDATRKTATSHTQHDNPSNLDMQQGGLLLEQQPSFPGESGAFHAECGREQGDELLDCLLQLCSTGEMNCQETDARMYYLCVAGYDFGYVEEISSESLKPKFIEHPRSVLVTPGSTAMFSTETRGVNVTYAWKHDGKYMNGEDREYLIIHQASVRNEGKYECVASNKYGMVSSEYAYLKLKCEKDFFQERTMIPQSIDPIPALQYYPILEDDQNLDQSDQDVDFGAYNIVSTEAKDTELIQLLASKNQLDSQLQKRENDSHTSSSPSSVAIVVQDIV